MTSTELYHYGILGMRWGQRNGPPYPLSSQAMNSSERRQNTSKATSSASTSTKRKKKKDPRRGMSTVERKWAQGKEEETNRTKDYKPRALTTTKHTRLKTVKQMSDEELNERIERLTRESRYLQLEKSLDDLDTAIVENTLGKALGAVGSKVVIPALSAGAGVIIATILAKTGLSGMVFSTGADGTVTTAAEFIRKAVEVALLKKK